MLVHEAGRQGVLKRRSRHRKLPAEVVDRALGRLAGASLVTFSVDGSSVSAHRLVMRVIREQLAAGNSLMAVCAAAAQLLDGLAESLFETWHEDRAAVRDLVEQIMALYESSSGCPADSALARRMIDLRGSAVWFMNKLGDSAAQSILLGEPLLADRERVLGADHPDTLTTRNNLALAYWAAGRAAEAITLLEQTLADEERVLGADHPGTLTTRNNLANAYQAAGRTAEAITLHEQTLADMERVLGADHPVTLARRSNLALAYRDTGRTAEVITLYEQTLADMERVLGADHPGTLTTRSNLALAYRDTGRTAEAFTLYEQTLPDMERVLGADHAGTLGTRDNLAASHRLSVWSPMPPATVSASTTAVTAWLRVSTRSGSQVTAQPSASCRVLCGVVSLVIASSVILMFTGAPSSPPAPGRCGLGPSPDRRRFIAWSGGSQGWPAGPSRSDGKMFWTRRGSVRAKGQPVGFGPGGGAGPKHLPALSVRAIIISRRPGVSCRWVPRGRCSSSRREIRGAAGAGPRRLSCLCPGS